MIPFGAVLAVLQKQFACSMDTAYYARIAEWRQWWCGHVSSFHTYQELGVDGHTLQRELYSLCMAKKICEDWASILCNESTSITVSDPKAAAFLQGENGQGGVLGENQFWQCMNALVEKTFALGTGACLLRVSHIGQDKTGRLYASRQAKIQLDFVEAGAIIPLSVRQGQITEAAFVSEVLEKGKPYIYLEIHALEQEQYVISNAYYAVENGVLQPRDLPETMLPRIETGSRLPWFVILRPNVVNHIAGSHGMGQSIYADAIATLKGVDIAYHNFVKDFKLGGKKVFYNKSMLRVNANGDTITPDDVAQSLFLQIDGDMDFDTQLMVQEFNPSLRVAENREGVQAQLNYLSFKCGLGTRRYRFSNEGERLLTATEYIGSQQELLQNAHRHALLFSKSIQTLCQSILYLGKQLCGADIDDTAEITVQMADGFLTDTETQREQDRKDVQLGLLQPFEYRMRWFGEDKQTAMQMTQSQERSKKE